MNQDSFEGLPQLISFKLLQCKFFLYASHFNLKTYDSF